MGPPVITCNLYSSHSHTAFVAPDSLSQMLSKSCVSGVRESALISHPQELSI